MFGKKSDKNPPSAADAIKKLREMEDMLSKKQAFLEKKVQMEVQSAKANATQNKTAAIQALKRKKRFERQLQQLDGALTAVEMQREALEEANTNLAIYSSMKSAAVVLKEAQKHMGVDKVYNVLDDIAEQQDLTKEITDAITAPTALRQDIDEDELEKELENLQNINLEEEMIRVGPSTPVLPDAPQQAIAGKSNRRQEKEKEEDLKKLEDWAR